MADSELSEPGEFSECFGIDFVVHECLQGSLPDGWRTRTRNSNISIAIALMLAIVSWLKFGTADHPVLGLALWFWLVYFYLHLGISFVLAAAIATPGCEMRAIPDLYGRLTGRRAEEHHCPAGFLTGLDAWERGRNVPPN